MFHQKIKECFSRSVHLVSSMISKFTYSDTFLTRSRKLPADKLITFLVAQGSSGTKNELADFFSMDTQLPTLSAFNQQRAKLRPDALEAVFHHFNHLSSFYDTQMPNYRFFAVDGSTFTFFSKPAFAPEEYHVSEGHSQKGFYSMHLNAFYDLDKHTYSDALIQPVHHKDEFAAFCEMVDRHDLQKGTKDVFIGDRGYCSYNNMAHVKEKGQYFLFRAKDIHSKGLVGNFVFPDADVFDIQVNVTLVRRPRKKVSVKEGYYKRFVDAATAFDYIVYGSQDTYDLSFRVVRFPLSEDSYECIVTNLPSDEFPSEQIKHQYFTRWHIEGAFRKLKYTIGLSNFHAYKPEYIKQEIWAKLIAYNMTEILASHVDIKKRGTKYEYKVNFSIAAHICRVFLRPGIERSHIDVMVLLKRELVPKRNKRQHKRSKKANFRKPRHPSYRAS